MREADRPSSERLSVLERPPAPSELDSYQSLRLGELTPWESVRLALRSDLGTLYLAPDGEHGEDAFFVGFVDATGGGASSSHPRLVLREHGVSVLMASRPQRFVVCGAASDEVLGVSVDGVEAALGENAYIVEVPAYPRLMTVARPSGTDDFEIGQRPSGHRAQGKGRVHLSVVRPDTEGFRRS